MISIPAIVIVWLVVHLQQAAMGLTGWTYENGHSNCDGTNANPCGPSNWGKVSGASGCGTSTSQSPINIDAVTVVQNLTITPPTFNFQGGGCSQWVAFTNQYVLEVAFNAAAENVACKNLSVTYGGVNYGLLQMHFHSPSEHTIGNGRFSAEAHMVHQSASGGYLVIGVFLNVASFDFDDDDNDDNDEYDDGINRNNKFLNSIWHVTHPKTFSEGGPNVDGDGEGIINPYKDLAPGRKSMYHYVGGLTTPPCVVPGGVSWWVYDEPVMVSYQDIVFLRTIVRANGNYLSNHGDNARPTQPVNGRLVSYIPGTPAKTTLSLSASPSASPTPAPSASPTPAPSASPTYTLAPSVRPSNNITTFNASIGIILGAVALGIALIACCIAIFLAVKSKSPAPISP